MHAQRCCHGCLCRHAWAQEMIAALGLLRAASALWAFNAGTLEMQVPGVCAMQVEAVKRVLQYL